MPISRRRFLANSAGFSLLSLTSPTRLLANALKERPFGKVDARQNLFLAFNNIKDPETGESDEFTTMRNLNRILREIGAPSGATIIGIGARTGTPSAPYAAPGEMGYAWTYGTPFKGVVTSTVDASPVALGQDDPIVVTQVAVLDESTAHHFEYNDPSRAGTALWTFYNDDTADNFFHQGMHNALSDVDGGLLNTIFENSQEALRTPDWGVSKARIDLMRFMPNLGRLAAWENLSKSLSKPLIHSEWLPYIRKQGWPGAAVVLRGSMMNVSQFHIQQWNRTNPEQPSFEIGMGEHGPLHLRFARESRPFITPGTHEWTMVGYIWDLKSDRSTPSMRDYRDFSDIFGQDFHIHGFRDDGAVGGHTLFSMLGEGKLTVSLYPLSFEADRTAFLFNNDLKIKFETLAQTSAGLKVSIKNDGQNWVRNVGVQLSNIGLFDLANSEEKLIIPQMAPGAVVEVLFKGRAGQSRSSRRELWVDRDGHFIEGGEGAQNNKLRFDPI